jgi:hypothetical protein
MFELTGHGRTYPPGDPSRDDVDLVIDVAELSVNRSPTDDPDLS